MSGESLEVERIVDRARFLQLKDAWDRLESGPAGHLAPMLTHDWFALWLEAFGEETKLTILALFERGDLVGVAPLHIVKTRYRGIRCRQLRLLHNRHAPACTFLVKRGHEDAVHRLMQEALALPDWDVLTFDNVPADAHLHAVCMGLAHSGVGAAVFRQTMSSPFLKIQGSWNEFFESRSRNTRRSIRKNEKRLWATGRVKVDHITDAKTCVAIMPTLIGIGNRSWKAPGGRAIGSQPESARFYTHLAEVFGERGEVGIWVMKLDGRPVAFEFHLVRDKRIEGLRAEFDDAFRSQGVGSVLDKEIVKRLFELGFEEYDMGGSADFYKERWTQDAVDHHEFVMFGESPTGSLVSFIERRMVGPVKKLIGSRQQTRL